MLQYDLQPHDINYEGEHVALNSFTNHSDGIMLMPQCNLQPHDINYKVEHAVESAEWRAA